MDEQKLHNKIGEMVEILSAGPPGEGGPAGSYVSHIPPPASRNVDDLLDHCRLQLKYVMFDLEATRRENRYLRQMLERRTNLGENPDTF